MVLDEHLFSFWDPETLVHARQRALPIKTLGTESLISFPVDMPHTLSQLITGRIKSILCDSTGRWLWEACAWFPPDFAPCDSSFADFSLYTFAVINHSSEYDHLLNPVSPPSKSDLEMILQTPKGISYLTFVIQTGLKQPTQIQQPYFSLS